MDNVKEEKIDPYDQLFTPRPLWKRLERQYGHLPCPFKTPVVFRMMSPPSCTKFLNKD